MDGAYVRGLHMRGSSLALAGNCRLGFVALVSSRIALANAEVARELPKIITLRVDTTRLHDIMDQGSCMQRKIFDANSENGFLTVIVSRARRACVRNYTPKPEVVPSF